VRPEILRTLPVTGELALLAMGVALLVALPVGILSAVRRNSWLDYTGRFFAIVGLSVPEFALATVALLLLSLYPGRTLVVTCIGLLSGWLEGVIDQLLQRLVDALMSIPGLVLGLALVAMLGPGFAKIMLALSVFTIPTVARTVRGTVLSAKQNVYVEAARSLGSSGRRILFRHVMPNVAASIIVVMTLQLGTVILGEAALSFLGLGVQPPAVSWGQMLSGPARRLMEQAPWLVIFPTLAISLTVLAINFLGDTLRDLWDPKLRDSQ
jgi:ABC-type dipeptide/oligopeptide/nickel transport system permease subunit